MPCLRSLEVSGGKESPLAAELKRVVDTRGWLSADFHSHSTPSGDNTASQRGRVLNLLAEHLEFAPCTEHNRMTVYDAHLKHFWRRRSHADLPGHGSDRSAAADQSSERLSIDPSSAHAGRRRPSADADPVVQIERLAMWDGGAEKLVQINHPNIPQMLGDRDANGSPDGGFEKMFSFMDVIEVHPLEQYLCPARVAAHGARARQCDLSLAATDEPGLSRAGRGEHRRALELSWLGLLAQLHQVVDRRTDQGFGGRRWCTPANTATSC